MEALSAPRFADMVVFLVDDDESPRNALVEHLLDWGCYVVDADSAAELIEKLRTEDIPLHKSEFILSDYRLKDGKTGVEAISAIRMQRGSQAIMAAIWTGESGPEVLREVAHAEIQLLTKPINLQELASALKKADVTDEMDVGRTFVPAK
jgi:CheY-like chemotaxis protein